MADRVRVPGVPFPLVPSSADLWQVDEATLTVSAQPHTDIFIDPAAGADAVNAESMLNAATLLGPAPEGDFQLSARVTVDFASTFDAGVLLLWLDERRWAKLCFEFSPAGQPMVVSVVRVFVLDDDTSRDSIGFEGQSPTGEGCRVTFDEIRFRPRRLTDLRDGS
jgi:uncharacterized protein